jgi:hypothetical protein
MVTTGTDGLRKVAKKLARGPRRPNRLLGFALARNALASASGPAYLAEPNVFALNDGINAAKDGQLVAYREFDIVHNRVGVMPTPDLNPFLVRLRHGVAQTNAEALAVSNCCGNQPTTIVNAAETLAATMNQTGDWFVAKRAADIAADRIDLAPDVRTRLQRELAGGSVLLIDRSRTGRTPQNPMTFWNINPATGDAVGLGENLSGQELAEYVIVADAIWWGVCMHFAGRAEAGSARDCKIVVCTIGLLMGGVGYVSVIFKFLHFLEPALAIAWFILWFGVEQDLDRQFCEG